MSDLIGRAEVLSLFPNAFYDGLASQIKALPSADAVDVNDVTIHYKPYPSAEAEKKKAELKENGDWDCPDVVCDECDHHRSVSWCSLAIPNHEEIDETYKMVNEAFFKGFNAAEKQYRFLIETVEKLDKKSAEVEWIPCSERLPRDLLRVNVTWINHNPPAYYQYIKGIPQTDTAVRYNGNWYWWDSTVIDVLAEYGEESGVEQIDKDIEVVAWMPLPKPYKAESEEV